MKKLKKWKNWIKKVKKKNNQMFTIEKEFIYRLDYFKMLFIGNFLCYAKKNLYKLLDNCSFCKKF